MRTQDKNRVAKAAMAVEMASDNLALIDLRTYRNDAVTKKVLREVRTTTDRLNNLLAQIPR